MSEITFITRVIYFLASILFGSTLLLASRILYNFEKTENGRIWQIVLLFSALTYTLATLFILQILQLKLLLATMVLGIILIFPLKRYQKITSSEKRKKYAILRGLIFISFVFAMSITLYFGFSQNANSFSILTTVATIVGKISLGYLIFSLLVLEKQTILKTFNYTKIVSIGLLLISANLTAVLVWLTSMGEIIYLLDSLACYFAAMFQFLEYLMIQKVFSQST